MDDSMIESTRSYLRMEDTQEDDPSPRTRKEKLSSKEKKRRSAKRTCLLVSRVLFVFASVVLYCALGASVLHVLESPIEEENITNSKKTEEAIRVKIYQTLLNISNDTNISYALTEEFISEIASATLNGSFQERSRNWEYIQAYFFVVTVITSIGFGNVSPDANMGRPFVAVFALIGLPLAILLLANLGKLWSRIFKICLKPLSKSLTLLIVSYVCLLAFGLIFIVFLPAIIFWYVENWPYLDALYFCFIALSTIGFGDVVVLTSDDRPPTDAGEVFYVIFIVFWLFVGLAYLALIIQEVVVLLVLIWKFIGKKLPCCKDTMDEEFEERPLEKLVKKAGKKVKRLRLTFQNRSLTSNLTHSMRNKRGAVREDSSVANTSFESLNSNRTSVDD